MRGPKPMPTSLRVLTGNRSKKPIPKDEPKPPDKMPRMPTHLCSDAKKEWKRIAPGLHAMGVLTEVDRAALAAYCTSYALWEKSWRAIKQMEKKGKVGSGLMIYTKNGNAIQNPLVGTANKAAADMIRYAGELGITPAARTRIKTSGPNQESEADKFFT